MPKRPPIIAEGWITISEAATLTGYHPAFVRTLAKAGKITAYKLNRDWWVEEKSLLAYQEAQEKEAQKKQEERIRQISSARQPISQLEGFVTIPEAAAISGYSKNFLRILARQKKIAAVKVGNIWLINRESLSAYRAEVSSRRSKRTSRQNKTPADE